MTLDELETAFDRWGSRIETWPEDERRAARALLASDPAARQRLDIARRLDGALARVLAPPPAPMGLAGRIAARLPRPAPARPRLRLLPVLGGVASVAASAVIGLWLGFAALDPPDTGTVETTLALADGAAYEVVVGPVLADVVPEDQR